MPEGAVYVGRPSLFGNPWTREDAEGQYSREPWREWCVKAYRREIEHWGMLVDYEAMVSERKGAEIRSRWDAGEFETFKELIALELRGKDLACWCPLEDVDGNPVPCHADVLLEWANR